MLIPLQRWTLYFATVLSFNALLQVPWDKERVCTALRVTALSGQWFSLLFYQFFPTCIFYKKIWEGNQRCLILDVVTRNIEFVYSNTHVFTGNSHKHMHSAFFLPSLPHTPTKERQKKKSPTCFSQREPVLELNSLQRSSIVCKQVICFVKNCSSCLHASWKRSNY